MKKVNVLVLAGALVPLALYAAATLRTDSGFYYPTDKTHAQSTYYAYGDKIPFFGNSCHLANDYNFAEGTNVYAVGPGVVESASLTAPGYGSNGTSGGVIVVKHTKSDDTFFYGLYGHIKNFTVAAGDSVSGGQKIAEVGPYLVGTDSQPHLHFSINPASARIDGYTPTAACSNYLGFVDPEPYLIANSPKLSAAETCSAVDDADDTPQNTILTTANVLANDTDIDGDTLTVSAADANSANGIAVTNNGDGTFTYTPAIDFSGTDSFNYTISDGNGCTDEATFKVTVIADVSVDAEIDTDTDDSGSSGGGSLNVTGLISLFVLLLTRRFRKRLNN